MHMPPKILTNSPSGKINVFVFFQFQFNPLKPTQHDLNTNAKDTLTAPSVTKPYHQTYQLFLEQLLHPFSLS